MKPQIVKNYVDRARGRANRIVGQGLNNNLEHMSLEDHVLLGIKEMCLPFIEMMY